MKLHKPEEPKMPNEGDSISILKGFRDSQDFILRNSKRATFFINLVYLLGLCTYVILIMKGYALTAVPALALVTLEVFIINALIYSITKVAKKQKDEIDALYIGYEYRRTHAKGK